LEAQQPAVFINGKLGNLKITPTFNVPFCAYVDIPTGSTREFTQLISKRDSKGMSVCQQITVSVDGTHRWWVSISIDTNHNPVKYPIDIHKTMGIDFRPTSIMTSTGFKMTRILDALASVTSYPDCAALAKKYEKNQKAIVMKQREVSRKYELHKRAIQTFKATHICPVCGKVASDTDIARINTFCCSCGFAVWRRSKNYNKAKYELSLLHARSSGMLTNLRRHIVHSWVASDITTFVIQDIPLNEGFKRKAKTDEKKKPRRWRGSAIKRRNINKFTHKLAAGTLRTMLIASASTMQKNVIVVSSEYDPLHTCSCGNTIPNGATMCDVCGDVAANAATRLLYIPFDNTALVLGAKSGAEALRKFGKATTQREARKQAKERKKAEAEAAKQEETTVD
jgi:predicted  nucleic acid-binding Zn-ribbon protein